METDVLIALAAGLTYLMEFLKGFLKPVKEQYQLTDVMYSNIVKTIALVFACVVAVSGGREFDIIARLGITTFPAVFGQITAAFLIVFANAVFHALYDRVRQRELQDTATGVSVSTSEGTSVQVTEYKSEKEAIETVG